MLKSIKKEDVSYWILLAIVILIIYFVFSDGQFSLIFTLAGTVQTFGFLLIVLKINKTRSVVGLSLQTFISYTIIFGIRSIIFIFYKVPIMANCRDIYLKIQQEISYLYYNNLWQLLYQGTFST